MAFPQLSTRHRLSTKLLLLSVLWLVGAMVSIGFTLFLSWKLEGGAAAINDAGSLRMRTYRATTLLSQQAPPPLINEQILSFENTLNRLEQGDPSRPLFLPETPEVQVLMEEIRGQWNKEILPFLHTPVAGSEQQVLREVDAFVARINTLVQLIETDNAHNTWLLRMFQIMLIGMATLGAISMMYLLYLVVIQPVGRLHQAMQRITQGDLTARVEIPSRDELGEMSLGFNRMTARLQELVQTMEAKVREKTSALEASNQQLSALYQVTTFLQRPSTLEEACTGFLRHVISMTHAQAGVVRVYDGQRNKLDTVAQVNMPAALLQAPSCSTPNACDCNGAPLQDGLVLRPCQVEGLQHPTTFTIGSQQEILGTFTLFFPDHAEPTRATHQLLEVLGNHLGVTIANTRLIASDRQLAVMEERNLMAQGLHDSIAQSLSFLNLQVQMLETALQEGQQEQANENLAFIRAGLQESYEDVRELLLNFRTRIHKEELEDAVHSLLMRFEKQTGVRANLSFTGDGVPLSPQQQLQIVFILQEALSNVRKHAQAHSVTVKLHHANDFTMTVLDDGRGIDLAEVQARRSSHVGLSIMQERAQRIHASITIEAQSPCGTLVTLHLPAQHKVTS